MLNAPQGDSAIEKLGSASASLDMKAKLARELFALMIALVTVYVVTLRTCLTVLFLKTI